MNLLTTALKTSTVATFAIALALTGCGDDDGGGTDAGGTDTTTGMDTMTGTDSMGTDTMGTDTPGTDTPGTDVPAGAACTNDADTAAVGATYTVGGEDRTVAEIAQARGTSCFLGGMMGDALRTCTIDGINEDTMDAISMECNGCFADSVICAAANCAAECIDGGDDCTACRCGTNAGSVNCTGDFTTCSGIPTTCPE